MAIRFRHDAAGLVPPSNASTRKYGQSLVLQQNQQKYQGQQAGYDRLFDAYKQQNQNAFQWNRDADQRVFQANQQQAQNNFQLGRDKTRFEQQQQEAEAERQRKFMDDSRKQSSGMIMQDIQNGHYDAATARKLQQSLVDEAEALGNPNLDATMRAEALAKIRAKRLLDTANRMEKPPGPTPQEEFDKGIVVGPDGTKYRANSKGDYEPLPTQQQKPMSPAEALNADKKLQNDYRSQAEAILIGPDKDKEIPGKTDEERRSAVNALAMKLYEQDQKDFGGGQPAAPTGFGSSSAAYYNAPDSEAKSPAAAPAGIPITPPDSGQPPSPVQQKQPMPLVANSTSQNPWAEMAGAEQQPVATAPVPSAAPQDQASGLPTVAPPDFGKLVGSATDANEKAVISQIQGLVSQNAGSPDVVNALHVFVSPGSSKEDRLAAFEYLSTAGIDLNQMIAEKPSRAEKIRGVQEENQKRFGNKYDFVNGM